MNQTSKHILFLVFLLVSVISFSQNDTIEVKKNVYKFDLDKPKTMEGLVIGKGEKQVSFYDFLNKKEKPTPKSLDYYLNLGEAKSKSSLISMSTKPKVDDDVMVKRSFNGKDTTNKTIESHASLGTIESSTKFVRIEFADYGLVDGDRVRIYLNERIVEKNIMLTGESAFIELKMDKGYNRIDFSALNEGYVGPNTAAFMVYDDKGNLITAKAWNLAKNENATLGIIRY